MSLSIEFVHGSTLFVIDIHQNMPILLLKHHLTIFTFIQLPDWYYDISRYCIIYLKDKIVNIINIVTITEIRPKFENKKTQQGRHEKIRVIQASFTACTQVERSRLSCLVKLGSLQRGASSVNNQTLFCEQQSCISFGCWDGSLSTLTCLEKNYFTHARHLFIWGQHFSGTPNPNLEHLWGSTRNLPTGGFKFSSTNSHVWEELEWHHCPHWVHGSVWWQSSPYQIETTGCPGRRLHHHAYSVTRLCMHTYTCNASDEGDLCHSEGIELLKQSIPPGIFRRRCWDLTPSLSFSASTQIGWSSWGYK